MTALNLAPREEKPRGNPAMIAPYQFKPGQSGNPGGKSAGQKECLALAREASPNAMRKLIDLMQSCDDRVAIMAADKVLERAYGKAKEQTDEDQKPAIDLSKCPPEALALIKAALAMMAGTAPTQTVIPPETGPGPAIP